MKTLSCLPRRSPRGFTLVELLTVIAIIGILAAILIPVAGSVRESARKAQCVSNVRQIGIALINGSSENRQRRFPVNGGYWAWDMSRDMVNRLMGGGGPQVIYCPSGMIREHENLWSFGWDFVPSSYVILVPGTGSIPQPEFTRDDGTTGAAIWAPVVPEEESLINGRFQGSYRQQQGLEVIEVPANKRVLVADAVLSQDGSFTDIPGGLEGNRTNHLRGAQPVGGHICFVDGHVEWRSFPEMERRNQNNPQFYW